MENVQDKNCIHQQTADRKYSQKAEEKIPPIRSIHLYSRVEKANSRTLKFDRIPALQSRATICRCRPMP
jgi:hypothetical protein